MPASYRWSDLEGKNGTEQLEFYKSLLMHLGRNTTGLVQEIYADANTVIRKPTTLNTLVTAMSNLDWYSAREEGLGDLYEGLLQKNAGENKERSRSVFHVASSD